MKLLLDTHALIWYATDDDRLSPSIRSVLAANDTVAALSPASLWEMAIKLRLGKLKLAVPFDALGGARTGGRCRGVRHHRAHG